MSGVKGCCTERGDRDSHWSGAPGAKPCSTDASHHPLSLSLTLSDRELEWLRYALAALASRHEADDIDAWRTAVNHAVRDLFQADQVLFLLAGCDADLQRALVPGSLTEVKPTASDGAASDLFGVSVAVSGVAA